MLVLVFTAGASTLLFSVLSGCTKQKETIKIGLATTLTGPASTSGIHSRNAVTLAVEEINRSGGIRGRMVELIIKDDKGHAEDAVRVDRELVQEGVVAIIGHYLSTLCVKAVPFINESKVLMLATGSTTPELTGLDDYLIRLMVPDDRRTRLIADMAYDRYSFRKTAVIYDLSNPNHTIPFSDHFQKNFTQKGGEISVAIPFNSLEKYSAADIAQNVITSGADGVLIITNAINGALLCQHLRLIDPEIKITTSPWTLPESDFIKNGGRAVEGATCLVELNLQSSDRKTLDFNEQYKTRFDDSVSINGYIAYESAHILFEALAKTEDPETLKDTILQQGRFTGITDTIHFDEFGDPRRPLYILEIQDSVIKTVGQIGM